MEKVIILIVCTLSIVFCRPTLVIDEVNCPKTVHIRQIASPSPARDFTHFEITLNIPEEKVNQTGQSSWRLELQTNVPFQFISVYNLWIKHFPTEGRAIIRNEPNETKEMKSIQLSILQSEPETNENEVELRITRIMFSCDDGLICNYTLKRQSPNYLSTSAALYRKRRTSGNENPTQRRQPTPDRRWNLNQGKSYFLTTIDE